MCVGGGGGIPVRLSSLSELMVPQSNLPDLSVRSRISDIDTCKEDSTHSKVLLSYAHLTVHRLSSE